MTEIGYDRSSALRYARRWAYERNPKYYNFDNLGGDCTNFISQCLFSGCGVMNYMPTFGWYYSTLNHRSPSWTGVEFLRNFLVGNKGEGPYASQTAESDIQTGDVIQLGSNSRGFYHSLFVTDVGSDDIYVATHTFNAYMRKLSSYTYEKIRYLHIQGARRK